MRTCISCGYEEEENSSYCRNCGKKIINNTLLDDEKLYKEQPKTENKSLSGAMTLFLVFVLIIIGILIGFVMNFLEG